MDQPLEPSLDQPLTAEEPSLPSMMEIVGLIAAVIPFLVVMSSSHVETVDGVVHATYRDWLAVTSGASAIVASVLSALAVRATSPKRRHVRVAIAVVLLALGAYHVARGFGWVGPGAALAVA